MNLEKVKAGIFGLAVGDALGVPVECYWRDDLKQAPVVDMRAHGTHDQPAGTWSDDTSMTLCLMDSISAKGALIIWTLQIVSCAGKAKPI